MLTTKLFISNSTMVERDFLLRTSFARLG